MSTETLTQAKEMVQLIRGHSEFDAHEAAIIIDDLTEQLEATRAALQAWRAEAHYWYRDEHAPQSEFIRLLVLAESD